jgi:hypothetical protein
MRKQQNEKLANEMNESVLCTAKEMSFINGKLSVVATSKD